jgi:serine/threonine protein kinase
VTLKGPEGPVHLGEGRDHDDLVVAGWTLESRLGAGGFAEVWRARNADTGLIRALKLVRPTGEQRDDLKAWRHEVERLEGLLHPHILRFYDELEALLGEAHDD